MALALQAPDYAVLIVADLDRALHVCVNVLGLRLGHRSGPYAQLATGTSRLGLFQHDAMAVTFGRPLAIPAEDALSFELGFKVNDVDAVFAAPAACGVAMATSPTDRPWVQRTAYVRDPDGHLVELAEDR